MRSLGCAFFILKEDDTVYCIHCGAELPEHSRFCNNCGKSAFETKSFSNENNSTQANGALNKQNTNNTTY